MLSTVSLPVSYSCSYGFLTRWTVLKDEVETAMRLAGLTTLEDADPSLVNTAELDPLVPRGSLHPYARKRIGPRKQYKL
jgi:hypothetical protein